MLKTPSISDRYILEKVQEIFPDTKSFQDLYKEIAPGFLITFYTELFNTSEIYSLSSNVPGVSFKPVPKGLNRRLLRKVSSLYSKSSRYQFWKSFRGFPLYGIIDSPEQFISKYAFLLARCHLPLCVFFQYGGTPEDNSGWRWHKQGQYFGNQGTPTCEYFRNEKGFTNGVYFFEIHQVN